MVGARAPGTEQISQLASYFRHTKKECFLKDALWGGEVTHRSWPGGQGGKPGALVAPVKAAWQFQRVGP